MDQTKEKNKDTHNSVRPPIVVVMGHIDHGKTTLLDFLRKTKVAEKESGGITQHIGAYQVIVYASEEISRRKITFIDTPGHEAFSKMRSRGAKVADIAVLVVAADEGIKLQTKEAIEIIKENNLPFVVAINKIDKAESNSERVKQELAKENVLLESYGGQVPSVSISAKTGQNLDELLEMILLLAEIGEFKAHPEKTAEGVVIETHRDPQRGITATLLILDGTLNRGDFLAINRSPENIKILENFAGKSIDSAGPSSPALIAGLSFLPAVGEKFQAFKTKTESEKFISELPPQIPETKIILTKSREGQTKPVFNIILKADYSGSLEVLEESLKKIESDAITINIISSGVGNINESDVKLAMATRLVTVVGFKVKSALAVKELARTANIHILTGEVIYELIDQVKKQIREMIPPEIKRIELGKAKILKIFKKDGVKQIVGGRVEEGLIKKSVKVEIQRMKELLGLGTIMQLQSNKQDVDEVFKGSEFGVLIESKVAIEEGDVLGVYQEEVIKIDL